MKSNNSDEATIKHALHNKNVPELITFQQHKNSKYLLDIDSQNV